jgi:hypothetical protein
MHARLVVTPTLDNYKGTIDFEKDAHKMSLLHCSSGLVTRDACPEFN